MVTKNKIKVVVKVTVCWLLVILTLTIFFIYQENKKYQGKIYPNVYVDNINFGGKTKQDVEKWFQKKNFSLPEIKFVFVDEKNPVATLSGKQINLRYDEKGIADRLYLIGRSSHFPSRIYQQISTIFGWKKFEFDSWFDYDLTLINEIVSYFEEKYNKPAKNALFKFENGRVVSFRQEEKGLKIESQSIINDFKTAVDKLKKSGKNQTIYISKRIIEPEITLAKSNTFGIEELLGEGRSNYTHSIPSRIHNIILASSKFNGILIPRNKILSFNEIIGDISVLAGYQQAYIIKDGKTVLGDGGGVCQVSTTLFRAALNAGLPIIERWPHAYRVSYYENDSDPGFDATVFAPSVDLKIKNDTPAAILIETEIDKEKNLLTIKLFGKKDNRQVEISPVILSNLQPPPPPLFQDDPTMKKGQIRQIDFAAWGAKAYFNYKIIYPDKTIVEKQFFSNYRPWQAVYLQGIAD